MKKLLDRPLPYLLYTRARIGAGHCGRADLKWPIREDRDGTSTPCDTCSPTWYGLECRRPPCAHALSAARRAVHRRACAHATPGAVTRWESPGSAGDVPRCTTWWPRKTCRMQTARAITPQKG